nr:unnamed protein product [Callosobruchus analis]CAI5863892.1 unnamed protein product [Callosobruchus analis]
MNVPEPKTLSGQNEPSPHVIIGDEAFALKPYLLKPFPYKQSKTDVLKENSVVREECEVEEIEESYLHKIKAHSDQRHTQHEVYGAEDETEFQHLTVEVNASPIDLVSWNQVSKSDGA